MENIKNDYRKVLSKNDYTEIINYLIEDINPRESVENYFKYNKENNPSFLQNLLTYSRQYFWKEISELYKTNVINDSDKDYLETIISKNFYDLADTQKIEDAKFEIDMMEVRGGKLDKSLPHMAYANLYLEVLDCIVWDKGHDEEEDPFDVLTTKEKLYLLDLLAKNNGLDNVLSNKLLETTLSLIMGINSSTLEKSLKAYPTWFSKDKKTINELTARQDSLEKIVKKLQCIGKNSIFDKMSAEINTRISLINNEIIQKDKKK